MSLQVRRKPTRHSTRRMALLHTGSYSLWLPLVLRFYRWCSSRRHSRFLPAAVLFNPASCPYRPFFWVTTLSAFASSGKPSPSLPMDNSLYYPVYCPQLGPLHLATDIRQPLPSIPATLDTIHQLPPQVVTASADDARNRSLCSVRSHPGRQDATKAVLTSPTPSNSKYSFDVLERKTGGRGLAQ
ncbi:hypothetical protein D9619_009222 [Psilocybe cf. subviscida]|uniref:Uncharacterized protein n=1 Tax=Psilocybe cf. subviscida TaxID=2480587 RepID=A0A8H5BUX1_9AGAR|nr:hypothetical protein D9619_009222 [Psilocybe cf. subviscida]